MANPFTCDPRYRLELAYRLIPGDTKTLLDYGCGDGLFLSKIRQKIPKAKFYGFEVDRNKAGNIKSISLFKRDSLDIICLLDVIEHVPSEQKTLDEIYRVLKPEGLLLLSTPHKGLTEIFDPGNIKFRFPYFHKFLYKCVFRQKGYEEKFQKGNLISDISRQSKMWHRHYSCDELEALLAGKFEIQKTYYYALFFPILSMLDQALKWLFGIKIGFLEKLILMDSRKSYGKLSFSIFVKARKIKNREH